MSRFIGVLLLVLVCSSFKIEKLFSSFTQLIKAETEVGVINWPFNVISKGTWTMNALTLTATPTRNSNNAITMKGTANDYIEFQKVDINVKLNGLFLHSQSVDFKKTFDSPDAIEFNYNNFVPSFAPSGTYLITFTHKDTDGKQNGIWSLTFKL